MITSKFLHIRRGDIILFLKNNLAKGYWNVYRNPTESQDFHLDHFYTDSNTHYRNPHIISLSYNLDESICTRSKKPQYSRPIVGISEHI